MSRFGQLAQEAANALSEIWRLQRLVSRPLLRPALQRLLLRCAPLFLAYTGLSTDVHRLTPSHLLPTLDPDMAATRSLPLDVSRPANRPAESWDAIVSCARPFLTRVSAKIAAQVDLFEPEIAGYARYALGSQGKQLRPALVALSGGAIGSATEELVTLAVIIEMVHLATLVHDDIMDEAEIRRRKPTLAARWGNEVSVLLGDCLFAHALKLASEYSTPEVCREVAVASGTVCAGEIMQNQRRRRWNLSRAEYFKVIGMKTAELFALATSLSAQLAGGSESEVQSLREYGYALGTAYQIYDDCLDLYGFEDEAGKSLGTDLASGKVTLPLLQFFENAGEIDRARMIHWLENWNPSHFVAVRGLLESQSALTESCRVIEGFLNTARSSVSKIHPGPEADALVKLANFLAQQTAVLGV